MNNSEPLLPPLLDISTIDACHEPRLFEANEELCLLQGIHTSAPTVVPPLKTDREPPQNTESNQSYNPAGKKIAGPDAETYWSSRGTFTAELYRIARDISFETEAFDIYNPIGHDESTPLQNIAGVGVPNKPHHKGKPTSKYIMDFGKPHITVKKKVPPIKSPLAYQRKTWRQLTSSLSARSLVKIDSQRRDKRKETSKEKPHPVRQSLCSIKPETAKSLLSPDLRLLTSPRISTASKSSLVSKLFKQATPSVPPATTTTRKLKKRHR